MCNTNGAVTNTFNWPRHVSAPMSRERTICLRGHDLRKAILRSWYGRRSEENRSRQGDTRRWHQYQHSSDLARWRRACSFWRPPFKEVTDTVEGLAKALVTTLKKVKPRAASVEFGVQVGIESGKLTALLVKGTGNANLKITLEWGEITEDMTR